MSSRSFFFFKLHVPLGSWTTSNPLVRDESSWDDDFGICWGDRVMESQFPAQSLLEKQPVEPEISPNGTFFVAWIFFPSQQLRGVAMFFSYLTRNRWPHLLGLAANLGKLGEAGCFFQAEKTQWYKFYNYGVFCFLGGVGSCETTSWPFQNRWHQLLLGSSLKSRRMKCFGLGRSYPENPKSRGGFEKCEKCSPLILGGWFSSLQKVHIKIGSTPCVSWEILILPADRAIEHEVDEDPVLKLVKIFLHSFIYIYTYIYISYIIFIYTYIFCFNIYHTPVICYCDRV